MTAKIADMPIDMAGVGRVARRVGLQNLVLVRVQTHRYPTNGARGLLEPDVSHDHRLVRLDRDGLEVESKFAFRVSQGGTPILKGAFVYRLVYGVQGDEPVADRDARDFARANGAYHSWPFVRELLFGMTSKMGLPPFLLPVLSFHQPQKGVQRESVKPLAAVAKPKRNQRLVRAKK